MVGMVEGNGKKKPTVWFVMHDRDKTYWIEYDHRKREYYKGKAVRMVWKPVAQLLAHVKASGRVEWMHSACGPCDQYIANARAVLNAEGFSAVRAEDFINLLVRPLMRLPKKVSAVVGGVLTYKSPYI